MEHLTQEQFDLSTKLMRQDSWLTRAEAIEKAIGILAQIDLLVAAREALNGMDGGADEARCHVGLTTRARCVQCRRVDRLRAAIAAVEELLK